jgi:hypothetical protein
MRARTNSSEEHDAQERAADLEEDRNEPGRGEPRGSGPGLPGRGQAHADRQGRRPLGPGGGQAGQQPVRNHLRPLVEQGYVKRAGRGEYTATAKGRKALGSATPKATAKTRAKAPAKAKAKAPAKGKGAKKDLRAELTAIRAQLKKLSGRVEKLAKKL